MKWGIFLFLILGFVFYCLLSSENQNKITISQAQAMDIAQKAILKAQPTGISVINDDPKVMFEGGDESVVSANLNNGYWRVVYSPAHGCCADFKLIGFIVDVDATTGGILGPWEVGDYKDVLFEKFLAARNSICIFNRLLMDKFSKPQ